MIEVIVWVPLALNVVLMVWLLVALRRMHRINGVLQKVVLQAWTMRHMPIWLPWCIARGYRFQIDVIDEVTGERTEVWK